MVKLGDVEWLNQLYSKLDVILVPLYVLAHTYFLYGPYWTVLSLIILIIGMVYFQLIFVAIVFISYFASDLLINQRILRSSEQSIRVYATLGLTLVTTVFLIMLATGGIEPYQGVIAFLIFYVLQARYRTSQLTIAKLSEIKQKKDI